MHEALLTIVYHWPMSIFDTTPVGRILNRFSADVNTIDNTLPALLQTERQAFFGVKPFKLKSLLWAA